MILSDQHYRLDPTTEAVHGDQHVLNLWERGKLTSRQAMNMIALNNGWTTEESFSSADAFVRFANSLGYWRDKRDLARMLDQYDK